MAKRSLGEVVSRPIQAKMLCVCKTWITEAAQSRRTTDGGKLVSGAVVGIRRLKKVEEPRDAAK